MYGVGDIVKYGINGVCKITEISTKEFGGVESEYYVLKPLRAKDSVYFVPCGNELLVSRMQDVLSLEEVTGLIRDIPSCTEEWIENDKKRTEEYTAVINSGDRHRTIGVIHAIRDRKSVLDASGKRLHISDERIMRDAERLINDEFATALGIDPSEVPAYIAERIER